MTVEYSVPKWQIIDNCMMYINHKLIMTVQRTLILKINDDCVTYINEKLMMTA